MNRLNQIAVRFTTALKLQCADLLVQQFIEFPDVHPVNQCMVAQHRQGQKRPVPLGKIFSPGDPGIAVRRDRDRLDKGGVGDPGERGDKDVVRRVLLILLDGAVLLRGLLLPDRVGDVFRKRQRVLQGAVAVGPVLQRHRVGGPAAVVLDNPPVHNPLPEFRDAARSPGDAVAYCQEKGQLLPLDRPQQVRDIHVDREPNIRVCKAVEICEVALSLVGVHIQILIMHRFSS